ncbi:MAG: molybdenum cofactor biosynthesis protein MoaE [Aigarchaeota archaeon]|nr:molybdenum cofactor biosynthesis protein MoaE [Aigarchaeota archaeon]MCX8193219.1 molybdenum cofactor biosynthesis protein MoaE [Nitrososphaeria archaeon]MDW7986360.1 molybdenum cofactor biosynthesis protein MoaE [Nitrososphaerota archaeon]
MEVRSFKYKVGVYEKDELDLSTLFQEFLNQSFNGEVGATLIFIGRVKSLSKENVKVSHLEIEAYKEYADRTISNICREVKEKYSLSYAGIWHLIGRFEVGEPLVVVLAAGRSREEVFNALRELVERYKKEPPLFKKEVYIDGSYSWLEE